jgi:WS/DGAT/MGAT family acyltransferase
MAPNGPSWEGDVMRRVAGPDATFLSAELPQWHFHISALLILDPRESNRFSLDSVRESLAHRLHKVPQFRWKLEPDPFAGLGRPIWVDDPQFDIDRHLHHVALPGEGDLEELGTLVGTLVSTKLNRARPLWEMWLIDGLEGGRSALLAKVHHSIIDGESGAELVTLLFDLEADPPPEPDPPPWQPADPPGRDDLIRIAAEDMVEMPGRALRLGRQILQQGATYLSHTAGIDRPPHPFEAPRTPLNGELTPDRSFACTALDLDLVKAVKNAAGVKLNDVVLGVVAGALRAHLDEKGELPESPLVAQVPVSMRNDGDEDHVGTKVSMMFSSLCTDLGDPAERLTAIHRGTSKAKLMRSALTAQRMMNLTDTLPSALLAAAARTWTAAGIDSSMRPVFNLIVSNVPGPPFDLFLAGARIESMYPMGPLLFGSGLNITVVSTADRLDVGLLSCPDLVPDGWDIARHVPVALDELAAAFDVA